MANNPARLSCAFLTLLTLIKASWADQDPGKYTTIYQSAWREGVDPRLVIQAPPDSISRVAMPQFGGAVLKASMLRSDDFSKVANGTSRAEVSFTSVANFGIGTEYEVRWSTMIPTNYLLDSKQPEIIAQLHQGSNQGSPPFALILSGQQYQVDVRGGAGTPVSSFEFGVPATDEGKVVMWLLRYRPDDTGAFAVTDLYKDGVLVVHAAGRPNAYLGDQRAYLKIGIYKWWWLTRPSDVTQRTMYYGDVEISGRPAHQHLTVDQSKP